MTAVNRILTESIPNVHWTHLHETIAGEMVSIIVATSVSLADRLDDDVVVVSATGSVIRYGR